MALPSGGGSARGGASPSGGSRSGTPTTAVSQAASASKLKEPQLTKPLGTQPSTSAQAAPPVAAHPLQSGQVKGSLSTQTPEQVEQAESQLRTSRFGTPTAPIVRIFGQLSAPVSTGTSGQALQKGAVTPGTVGEMSPSAAAVSKSDITKAAITQEQAGELLESNQAVRSPATMQTKLDGDKQTEKLHEIIARKDEEIARLKAAAVEKPSSETVRTFGGFGPPALPASVEGSKANSFWPSSSRTKKLRLSTDSSREVTSNPLTIIVGKDDGARPFFVHEGIIIRHSDYIATALKDGFKESEDSAVRLPNDNPDIFAVFLRFLYGGDINAVKNEELVEDKTEDWLRLTKCWCLGAKLQSASFKDCVLDNMIWKMELGDDVPNNLYETVYAHTPEGPNGLKRFVVDIAVWQWKPDAFLATTMDATWNEFFRDLALRQGLLTDLGRAGKAPFSRGQDCHYHDHPAEGKPCYKILSN